MEHGSQVNMNVFCMCAVSLFFYSFLYPRSPSPVLLTVCTPCRNKDLQMLVYIKGQSAELTQHIGQHLYMDR